MCGRCGILVGTVCRWCVDGVVYWLELVVGDVWTVWYTGWNWIYSLHTNTFNTSFRGGNDLHVNPNIIYRHRTAPHRTVQCKSAASYSVQFAITRKENTRIKLKIRTPPSPPKSKLYCVQLRAHQVIDVAWSPPTVYGRPSNTFINDKVPPIYLYLICC